MGGENRPKRDFGQCRDLMRCTGSGRFRRFLTWKIVSVILLAGLLVLPAMAAPTLSVSPPSGKAGIWVTVTGSSFDLYAVEFPQASVYFNGAVVASNVWFSGTGFSTSFQVPGQTPDGTYTVSAVGPRDSASTTFRVVSPPVADFSMSPSSGMGRAPLTVYFTDRSTKSPASWSWTFGDGGTSSEKNPVHTYSQTGTYTVTLTVSNAAGSSSDSSTVTVYTPTLVISPSSGKAGTQVTVTGTSFSLENVDDSRWEATLSFNGAVVARDIRMTKKGTLGSFTSSFTVPAGTAAGRYVVRAVGPLDSAETPFTIANTAPRALIDANPLSGKTPLSVLLSGTRSNDEDGLITSYHWDFGDDTSAIGVTADHAYSRPGEYRVTLTVTDNEKQSGTASVTIRAENTPPVAKAYASPTSGSDPLTVTFDGSQSTDPDGRIVSYSWDFGDGSREQTANALHQYRNLGSYTAVLTVIDDKGASDTGEIIITVGNDPPVAALSVSPDHGQKPLSVTFDGSGSRDPDDTELTYSWDFGDGESGTGIRVEHLFKKEGTYQISLTVTDPSGAADSAGATVRVDPPFPWEFPILVIGLLAGAVVAGKYLWHPEKTAPPEPLPTDWHFPDPGVHVDVDSGVEHPAGYERTRDDLPDISVDIKSGIWKEEDER